MILKPLVTEKTLSLATKNKYTFVVGRHATKDQIARLISNLYEVTVTKIQTTVIPPRSHRVGISAKRVTSGSGKKATISLAAGQKIDIYEVPEAPKDESKKEGKK